MNATIPVYRAVGRLYDNVTERGLVRLQAAGLIARVVQVLEKAWLVEATPGPSS
jgi:hypothetical protein